MRQLLPSRFALVVACTLLGCTTSKRTARPVREIRIDTLYVSNRQFDSIYIFRDRSTDYRRAIRSTESFDSPPDTLVIKERLTEYRYRLLHDTIRIHQVDSVPVIHEVEVIREVDRPPTRFDRLTHTTFWIVIGLLAACLLRFIPRI